MTDETTVVQGEKSEQETPEQVEARVEKRYRSLLEIWKNDEFAAYQSQVDSKMQELVAEKFEEWKKALQPPTKDDIEALLSQEYLSFDIKLRTNGTQRDFTISELPQAAERRFYQKFKTVMRGRVSELSSLAQRDLNQPMDKKLVSFFELIDGGLDILADACAIVLNPDGKSEEITREWCQENLSSSRMYNIVKAQAEVNRLRDFFSNLSVSGTSAAEMIGNRVSSLR